MVRPRRHRRARIAGVQQPACCAYCLGAGPNPWVRLRSIASPVRAGWISATLLKMITPPGSRVMHLTHREVPQCGQNLASAIIWLPQLRHRAAGMAARGGGTAVSGAGSGAGSGTDLGALSGAALDASPAFDACAAFAALPSVDTVDRTETLLDAPLAPAYLLPPGPTCVFGATGATADGATIFRCRKG